MLIQQITNCKYNTNLQKTKPNTSFQGQLGEKVLQEITAKTPINDILKKFGIGVLGSVSIGKLVDILGTWKEKTEKDTKTIEELVSTNIKIKQDFKIKSEEINNRTKELDIKERDLSVKEQHLRFYEQANKEIKEQNDKKEIELNERKKELNKELNKEKEELDKRSFELYEQQRDLDRREYKLEKREKSIEETTRANVTAQIRAEEQKKAEENVINIMNALDERENAITSAENLIKEAEIENIKNGFRVLYGDKDIDISKVTDYGTQLLILVNTFNSLNFKAGLLVVESMLDKMRNKENIVTEEMFQFVKLLATYNCQYYRYDDFVKAIDMVKDKNGSLDLDKSSYLLAIASIKGHMSPVIEAMKNRYGIENKNSQNLDSENQFLANLNNALKYRNSIFPNGLIKDAQNLKTPRVIEAAILKIKETQFPGASDRVRESYLELQNLLERKLKEINKQ